MADITINIPTDKVSWVLDGFAKRYNYQTDIPNPDFDENITIPNPLFDDQLPEDPDDNPLTIPNPDFDDEATITNPQNKAEFAKSFVIMYIKNTAAQGHVSDHQKTVRDEQATVDLT